MNDFRLFANIHVTWKEYASMLFFLSLCGNVFVSYYLPATINVITVLIFVFLYLKNKTIQLRINEAAKKNMRLMIVTYLFLFISQYFVFGWNTFPGIVNHICKFIIGAGYIAYMGDRFRIVFFKTMYHICLICLPLWLLQQFFGGIGGLSWSLGKTIWIYCYREGGDIVRNCGFFWEPGAMGGYIALLTLLFFNDLSALYRANKWKCIVILATLLSTQSTGGYMSFGTIIICYFAVSMRSKWKYFILPLGVSIALYAYNNLEFLSDKVNHQNEGAEELVWGEYSSTRSGTLYFDLYYIAKHPLIGNGLHERTRLADHQALALMLKRGDVAAAGNGFSDALAKWGLLYCIVYGLIFFRTNKDLDFKRKLFFLLLVCIILQGEQFMNYPLFLGIPMLQIINKRKNLMCDKR